MNQAKRPISIMVISCLFIATGALGLVNHFPWPPAFHSEDIWIEATEMSALVAGVFMLRGHNWARWLAFAWMAFHVAISFPVIRQIAIHCLFLAVIAWILFEPRASQYFASKRTARN